MQIGVDALLIFLCFVLPIVVSPFLAGLLTVRVGDRIREKLSQGASPEELNVGDLYSNALERFCGRIVLWFVRRGLSVGWACRLTCMILTVLFCLLINLLLLPVAVFALLSIV